MNIEGVDLTPGPFPSGKGSDGGAGPVLVCIRIFRMQG